MLCRNPTVRSGQSTSEQLVKCTDKPGSKKASNAQKETKRSDKKIAMVCTRASTKVECKRGDLQRVQVFVFLVRWRPLPCQDRDNMALSVVDSGSNHILFFVHGIIDFDINVIGKT